MDVDVDPADFYTGIVAEMYAPLKAVSQEAGPYAAFIRETGVPALELGCGDGDPLLALRHLGLDVEGVDSSADMLARCRQRAREQGVGELMLIGGAQLYGQALDKGLVNRMYLTRVELSPEGDAWFPEFDRGQWQMRASEPQPAEGHGPVYHFEVWDKV